MRDKAATVDATVARIAARQHGVVSTQQLLAAGLTRNAISRRVRGERLHRVHQGVYAVGHRGISEHGRWMAAVLACGGKTAGERAAVLSHRSAAALWNLQSPRSGPIDVSIAGDGGRERRKGIRLHRTRTLTPALTTRRHSIPVTTPARTVADLRRVVSARELRGVIRQADVLALPIGMGGVPDRTRSELERLFLRLCRKHSLSAPEVNVWIGSLEVDFLWRDRRLIVETDGFRYHRGRVAFENDRDRDLRLRALGYEVVRLSYQQVAEDPNRVGAALKEMLRS